MRLLLLNKPYHVLTRFSPADGRRTLADVVAAPGLYPAGRLDYDSEGLLLLTDDGILQARITDPRHALPKTYWVQVEGLPGAAELERLRRGVLLADGLTRPAGAQWIPEPAGLWPRDPPIRHRARIPTAWLELTIHEGRNRQVRRMTAAVGLPTLRLIRARVGPFTLEGLPPGASRAANAAELAAFSAALASGRPTPGRSASPPRGPARSSGAGRPSSGRPARGRPR
jgi:23S rRNA pseudouridine2457 synthase